MENLRVRDSVAMKVDEHGDFTSVSSNKHFSVREDCSQSGSSDPTKIMTAFVWKSEAKAVALSVSTDRFRPHPMVKTRDGHFACVIELSPGVHHFRFLVDGDWRVNEDDKNIIIGKRGERLHMITVSSEVAEESLKRDILNHEVLKALSEHKEEVPKEEATAFTVSFVKKKNRDHANSNARSILRKPLSLLNSKSFLNKSAVNGQLERPHEPPKKQDCTKAKFIQAEDNAQERQEVARAMFKRGTDDGALALYKVALTIREENGLTLTPANAHCHAEMAMVFMKVREYPLAESHLRAALRIWRDAPSFNFANEPKHRYGDMCHYLAVVLERQKKYDDAHELYKLALKIYTKYVQHVEPRKVEAVKRNMHNNKRKVTKHKGGSPLSATAGQSTK
mmetsp:Transcript_10854/g.33285  ORF Transcript_10854/g.33285 Transcript_10854/m.33285 type:complete len:393 (-) Transcript_10854:111-1289(-)